MLDEFRKFIAAGNVVDLAVGVIVGGMFGKIVAAFVDDLVNPLLGTLGKADFTNLYVPLSDKVTAGLPLADARKLGPVLAWGDFVTVVINTLLTAFAIFLVVKGINRMRTLGEKPAAPVEEPAPAPPAEDIVLLGEIRDLLRSKGA
ncbi:MAG: large conductance mechanosensitive channel protein MscL [Armatimonadota bacterium]